MAFSLKALRTLISDAKNGLPEDGDLRTCVSNRDTGSKIIMKYRVLG